jgi:exopolyphosphatase / guanosine-5'-triphosphate,3'-diphosphate pyrophosphatase
VRLASIDLGSNTVRLLVAEIEGPGVWRLVDQDQQVTRLGEGLSASGRLGAAPMARTIDTVLAYVDRAARGHARDVRIVATSAVREAANGRDFADELGRRTGQRVQVISGEDEARLTLRGVVHGLGGAPGLVVVFDIGGGSTEYVRARDGVLMTAVSLRLGVVPLGEAFPFTGPVDWARYARLEHEVRDQLTRELPGGWGTGIDRLVGTAGTVTTLAALDLALATYDAHRVQGHVLSARRIQTLLERLGHLSLAERGRLPCLEPGRADLIVPGLAIVRATMEHLGVDAVTVSDAGLREGILVDALGLVESRRI